MKFNLLVSAIALGLFLAGGTAVAHHGFMGAFDLRTATTFEGVITKVDWVNPHISFFVEVKDAAGKVTNWRFEGASPSALRLRGWGPKDLKTGDRVVVKAHRATNGAAVAAAGPVELPDGRTLDAASDGVVPNRGK